MHLVCLSKEVLDEVHLYGEMPLYSGLCPLGRARLKEIAVRHTPKIRGFQIYPEQEVCVILDLATVGSSMVFGKATLFLDDSLPWSDAALLSEESPSSRRRLGGNGFWTGDPLYTDPFSFSLFSSEFPGFRSSCWSTGGVECTDVLRESGKTPLCGAFLSRRSDSRIGVLMCGIAGMYRPGGLPEQAPSWLHGMTRGVQHRGPDATGSFVENRVALGHRRLQVIDLEGGLQPFETDRVVLSFNGEIYNYRELRAELEVRGVVFQTASDTEVLARGWEIHGRQWLTRLNGMYAFAVWEKDTGLLTLCRDPMGQKPLSYFRWGDGVVFGSEWSALRQHPDCPNDLDAEGLRKFFLYDYVPGTRTLIDGIERVEPGQWIAFGPSGPEKGSFFQYDNLVGTSMSEPELESAFEDAVRMRLRSDVPLRIFLSGGIDSSLLVARATQTLPGPELHTFSRFEDPSFDESSHASREELLGPDITIDARGGDAPVLPSSECSMVSPMVHFSPPTC